MSQTRERETAAVCLLREVERWNPRFRHAHSVLRGSEVEPGRQPPAGPTEATKASLRKPMESSPLRLEGPRRVDEIVVLFGPDG
jgi:hypothetical protein